MHERGKETNMNEGMWFVSDENRLCILCTDHACWQVLQLATICQRKRWTRRDKQTQVDNATWWADRANFVNKMWQRWKKSCARRVTTQRTKWEGLLLFCAGTLGRFSWQGSWEGQDKDWLPQLAVASARAVCQGLRGHGTAAGGYSTVTRWWDILMNFYSVGRGFQWRGVMAFSWLIRMRRWSLLRDDMASSWMFR